MLSGGATEAILLALADGPLQTKVLTHRVRGYTPRTVYRYLPKLARLGLVERTGEPSGSSKVVNTLTAEAGRDMCAVIERFARASMTRLPGEQVELGTWGSLGLLADLWEAGVVEALSHGPRRRPARAASAGPQLSPGQPQGQPVQGGRASCGSRSAPRTGSARTR